MRRARGTMTEVVAAVNRVVYYWCGVEKDEEEILRTERGIGGGLRCGVEVIDRRWDGSFFWGFGEVFGAGDGMGGRRWGLLPLSTHLYRRSLDPTASVAAHARFRGDSPAVSFCFV
jgi:hypothetical protein